ncbi:2-(1,2-epoxy-1,2-dihydrophenyl)acetyl-CoA isomerase [Roseivirga pacifica]|nr:2-(1,2-epoxy-1,2-dihydrophenyl)acetyl-CoA isomerase [Roseivirga pacifica]MCO6366052.1 2-(1,2-epoxy-1,2-dihydrophenyl)acetyl-CoA isomerase [Roseivirga pacifica]MCO6371380.1 2-(1,2-epoxy-1,2-dihydrophenyl)acetyl-CoA isomerase [Roseivirga pacifica]MCO6375448.1 2-(1,2-epoxy-1,2-dihydrophenyl)acetyl-CoA isomerase [Roseivirga pacifica]MCO6378758.1 2-(1,2-epoxy-1,2-dihydrophenyl)acetyl-CoA isomerase [Roseivirga pacifica]
MPLNFNQTMTLEITQKENLGIIRFNRPEAYNSFTREMSFALIDALNKFNEDKTVRAVLLTGNGKAFCAGQDLKEAVEDNGLSVEQMVEEHYNPIVRLIRKLEKPVIAAVNGVAAGAGANIAFACDIAVATKSAAFIQAFSKIGLVPDSGGTFFLPRLVGFQKASALMMLGDKVSAEEAEQMNMIYKVFDDDVFAEESEKLAMKMSQMPTKALAYTKHLLNQSFTNDLDTQLDQEKEWQAKSAASKDSIEGIQAFVEKRKPEFTGE